ncbi:hypothetical protein HHK36_019431 [Tetracentron sinense]|uniref:PGG domain-containing protein n=1 Tax=Tetracentron sinense TaxID=13715 RepID=A0A834YXC8_TETSI|nr:hypothetical protein HHK36_019431 [Tetracentron sinense]
MGKKKMKVAERREQRADVPEELTRNNYEKWKVGMKSYLEGKGLWDVVDETEPELKATSAKYETWRKKNEKALQAIRRSCGSKMALQIREMESAKDAWDHLASIFELDDGRTAAYAMYRPLYKALVKGDWKSTKIFLDQYPHTVSGRISSQGETALHVAAMYGHVQLIQELVNSMPAKALAIRSIEHDTALHIAAIGGITMIAKAMVAKSQDLLCLRNKIGLIPVTVAALSGNKEMVDYLYAATPREALNPETSKSGAVLLTAAISADMYYVASDLLQLFPQLATVWNSRGETALHVLAKKPRAFQSGSKLGFWQKLIYKGIYVQPTDASFHRENRSQGFQDPESLIYQCLSHCSLFLEVLHWSAGMVWNILKLGIKKIYNTKLNNFQALQILQSITRHVKSSLNDSQFDEIGIYSAIFVATELGIVEFIEQMMEFLPMMMFAQDDKNAQNILQIAVVHRQEGIFNLILTMDTISRASARVTDISGNNVLHLAGVLAPPSRLNRFSGAAMQMQQELQWFKEVEKLVEPAHREDKNKEGKTPQALFTDNHEDLVKAGEKWMKATATSCMVVAGLITTVMFAAAFTVPGGYNNDTGIPIFLLRKSFIIFLLSDALSLFSSCASLLIFLDIFMTSYAEENFLEPLPRRMIFGLATLFVSIVTMMVAFGAALSIILQGKPLWFALPISIFSCIPFTAIALLQFPFFFKIVFFTNGPGIFSHKTSKTVQLDQRVL